MALYITVSSNCSENYKHDIIWHVGNPYPYIGDYNNVIEVQADGDELELIRRELYNIRMTNNRVVNWYGDEAKFIATSLKYRLTFYRV